MYRSILEHYKEYLSSRNLFKVLGLSSVVILLIAQILVGIQKPLWYDEIATLKIIRVATLNELISLCYNGGDTNPPLYYIFLWFLRNIVGENIIIFRFLSSVFAVGGTTALYLFFKKIFNWKNDSPLLLFLFSMPLWQFTILMEIRAYALWYFLLCIYSILYYSYLNRPEKSFTPMLILTIVGTLMVYTHYYAVIYIGVLLVIEVLSFVRKKNSLHILILLLPIFFFLPWIPAIIHQREFLHGTTWQSIPTGKDIYYLIRDLWGLAPFSVLFLTFCYFKFIKKQNIFIDGYKHILWIIVLMSFLLIPVAVFITSQIGLTVFSSRYFMGTFISGILLAWIELDAIIQRFLKYQTVIFVLLVCLAGYRFLQYHKSVQEQIGKVNRSLSLLNYHLPIVCSHPHTYFQLSYYAHDTQNKTIYFVNDSLAAISPESAKNAMFDYYQLQSPFFHDRGILSYKELTVKFREFLVVDEPGRKFLQSRILPDPTYECKIIEPNIYRVKKSIINNS
jgi:hypothetical protein